MPVKEKENLLKSLERANIAPATRRRARTLLRRRMWSRYPSRTFFESKPRRGVSDQDVVVMHDLYKAGFGFREIEAMLHCVPNHGMGVWRAVKDRFPRISKTKVLSPFGQRRTSKPVAMGQEARGQVSGPMLASVSEPLGVIVLEESA